MGRPGLGLLLKRLREERGLSLRELAQIAEVDHAYIYRLEAGDKESPSEETLSKLIRALKVVGKREANMLRYIAEHSDTDPALVAFVLDDKTITYELFTTVAAAAFRGAARPDFPKLFERVRRILDDEHGTH
jgi:transcriptional regulator with XRE-family HTH domain